MIQTKNGHCWLTFENGYTISVFNGFGSYSQNHFNMGVYKPVEIVESKDCEIVIIYNNEFVTKKYIKCDDVKGYVSADELAEIIYKVKNLKAEKKYE